MHRASKIVVSAAVVSLMAACGNQPPPESRGEAQENVPEVQIVSNEPPAAAAGDALPDGFVLPFDHAITRDRIADTSSGRQRRLEIDVPGLEPQDVEKQLGDALSGAGYKPGKLIEREGRRSVNYRRDGKVALVASVGKADADAPTTLRIAWNI